MRIFNALEDYPICRCFINVIDETISGFIKANSRWWRHFSMSNNNSKMNYGVINHSIMISENDVFSLIYDLALSVSKENSIIFTKTYPDTGYFNTNMEHLALCFGIRIISA